MTHNESRLDIITNLHALADFLDAHPDIPVPSWGIQIDAFVQGKDELAAIARQTTWEKEYLSDWFSLHKRFGLISLKVNISREKVCRRVVTGTKLLPARPAQEVEQVEWHCDDPLLEPLVAGVE